MQKNNAYGSYLDPGDIYEKVANDRNSVSQKTYLLLLDKESWVLSMWEKCFTFALCCGNCFYVLVRTLLIRKMSVSIVELKLSYEKTVFLKDFLYPKITKILGYVFYCILFRIVVLYTILRKWKCRFIWESLKSIGRATQHTFPFEAH